MLLWITIGLITWIGCFLFRLDEMKRRYKDGLSINRFVLGFVGTLVLWPITIWSTFFDKERKLR